MRLSKIQDDRVTDLSALGIEDEFKRHLLSGWGEYEAAVKAASS